jgi:putative flippase GtrA
MDDRASVTVLLLVERHGAGIDALVKGLEAGGMTAIYGIAVGNQVESELARGRLLYLPAAQPGKAAAAACGLQAVYACNGHDCRSIVLVDTQHGYRAEDILAFAQAAQACPGSLVVAERASDGEISFLARLAGSLSQKLVKFFLGIPLNDMRSGMLAIPCAAVPALELTGRTGPMQDPLKVEFELEVILAGKRSGFPLRSQPVPSGVSGQAPAAWMMLNSMSLYFVLARYISTSLLTAVVDNLVFVLCYPFVHNVLVSIYLARLVAIMINYFLLRKVVFNSSDRNTRTFPKYVALVLFSGLVAALLITFFNTEFHISVVLGKIIAELLLYLVNFAVLNKLVFVHRQLLD